MRVLIVDDEPLARSHLVRLCAKQRDVSVIAQVDSGAAAIEAFNEHSPDLVLLDIQLNDMDGFEVLKACAAAKRAHAIMITAHSEYAVNAFESDAIDYLTKPVTSPRFAAAIDRARHRIACTRVDTMWNELTSELRVALNERAQAQTEAPRQLVGERIHRLYFIDVASIDYIKADGNYVDIHAGDESYISRSTLKFLEGQLQPAGFVRIQKSLLINLHRVEFAERLGQGVFAFAFEGGTRLVSSATYRKTILRELRRGQLHELRSAH